MTLDPIEKEVNSRVRYSLFDVLGQFFVIVLLVLDLMKSFKKQFLIDYFE